MNMNGWIRDRYNALRDFAPLVTVKNLILVLVLLGLHVLSFVSLRMAIQTSVEAESDLADPVALASQFLLAAIWIAIMKENRSRPPSKNSQHLQRLIRVWPDAQQQASVAIMSSHLRRPAGRFCPAKVPFHRLFLFTTLDRMYALVPIDPMKDYAVQVHEDLAAMRFEPYRTAAVISKEQVAKMTFSHLYTAGDAVVIYKISPAQLQLIALLREEEVHPPLTRVPLKENSDEE